MSIAENWTKFVTLNPPNEVKFKFEVDKVDRTDESQIEFDNKKATARIEIINKSKSAILFKVSLICQFLFECIIGKNHEY